jgi:hypothetical protein
MYNGKCSHLHGHRWTLHVSVVGGIQTSGPFIGMVMDFNVLSQLMIPIINKLDHNHLNDLLMNPTCENLLIYIAGLACTCGLKWDTLYLMESPGCLCELTREEYETLYAENEADQ